MTSPQWAEKTNEIPAACAVVLHQRINMRRRIRGSVLEHSKLSEEAILTTATDMHLLAWQ